MTEEQILDRKILLKKQLVALMRKDIRQMQKALSKKKDLRQKRCPRSLGETTGTVFGTIFPEPKNMGSR